MNKEVEKIIDIGVNGFISVDLHGDEIIDDGEISEMKKHLTKKMSDFLAQELSKRDELHKTRLNTMRRSLAMGISELKTSKQAEIFVEDYFDNLLNKER